MRAILHQRHKPQLRIGTRPTPAARAPKPGLVGRGVRHVQTGAIQTDQMPAPIPSPARGTGGDRLYPLLVELAQRRLAQPGARLREAALTRHLHHTRAPQNPQPLQQAAQHLAQAGAHEQRQGNHVIHHHRRRQVALAHARLASLAQHLVHLLQRKRLGDHPKSDVIAHPNPSRQAGSNTPHHRPSAIQSASTWA